MSIAIHEDYIKAGSPDTSVTELRSLANSSIAAVRRRVGENEKTPSDVLKLLSTDPKPEVRIAVGLSRFTPEDIVTRLVSDEHDDVRHWMASASYLPKKLLDQLSVDSNPYVADRAKSTLSRLGSSAGTLINVFEILSEDHGLILNKLETLIQNYSNWAPKELSDKTAEVLDDILQHLERRHTLCAHWFDERSGLAGHISRKCLADQESIIDHTSWLLAHDIEEPDFCNHLNGLLEQIRKHREFIENELFVEIKKHVPQKEIDKINERLNRTAV